MRQRRGQVPDDPPEATINLNPNGKDKEPAHLREMDAEELLGLDLPPMQQAIEGLLPEGLASSAPPKAGKSLLCYQMAVESVFGGDIFGINVERRPVLYYALEDGTGARSSASGRC